jgi:non-ribosomal peptide synthetase component F
MEKFKPLDRKSIEDLMPLTPMQEGMLFHYLRNPESAKHFEQLHLEISGNVESKRFREAWLEVSRGNEMLRTLFRWEQVEKPVQLILKEPVLQCNYFDFSGKSRSEAERLGKDLIARDRDEKFHLHDVPFRVTLYKIAGDKFGMIISNHHILYDGWSNGIILQEFFSVYGDLARQRVPVRPVKTKFKEFIKGVRGQERGKQEKFWQDYLQGLAVGPGDSLRRKREVTSTGSCRFAWAGDRAAELAHFGNEHKISLPVLFYSAWAILLQEYSGCRDVWFDTTVSGRPAGIPGIEHMVGLFINTLPLRVKVGDAAAERTSDLLERVKGMLRQREEFENTSQFIIKEYLEQCRYPLPFDSVVVIENYPLDLRALRESSEFTIDSYESSGTTGYDLTLLITLSDGIAVEFVYNTDLFAEATAVGVMNHFVAMVEQMVRRPRQRLAEIGVPPSGEKSRILSRLNARQRVRAGQPQSRHEYTAPRDDTEKKLAVLWHGVFRSTGKDTWLRPLGIDDNFFDFGGHSLKASLLAAQVHREFQVKVPLVTLFQYPTIRELAQYIKIAGKATYSPLQAAEAREYYPLSSAQQRMYALQQLDRELTAYNVSTAMVVEGRLNPQRLNEVFKKLIQRHEIFRTSFVQLPNQPEPVQLVHCGVEFAIRELTIPQTNVFGGPERGSQPQPINCSALEEFSLPPGTNTQHKGSWPPEAIVKDFVHPFDLTRAPLIRVGLIGTGETRSILVLDMHHIITDGVSMDVVINEFIALYRGEVLPPLNFQYRDFSQGQHRQLISGGLKPQEKFWLREFPGELPVLNLLTDFPRPSIQQFTGDRLSLHLDSALAEKLKGLAAESRSTLFIVLLAALNVLLSRYTGQEDIVVGTTVAGRGHADLQPVVGLFIETLALRNWPAGHKTFRRFLAEVREKALNALENSSYPFRELINRLGAVKDVSRNPLFNVMLIVQNVELAPLEIAGLTFTPLELPLKVAKVDFTLEVFAGVSGIRLDLEYCTQLYRKETMERLAGHFMTLLENVANHPGLLLAETELLGPEEERQIRGFSKNTVEPLVEPVQGTGQSTHRLFEEQVKKRADGTALVYRDSQMTYGHLQEKVDLLAKIIAGI